MDNLAAPPFLLPSLDYISNRHPCALVDVAPETPLLQLVNELLFSAHRMSEAMHLVDTTALQHSVRDWEHGARGTPYVDRNPSRTSSERTSSRCFSSTINMCHIAILCFAHSRSLESSMAVTGFQSVAHRVRGAQEVPFNTASSAAPTRTKEIV